MAQTTRQTNLLVEQDWTKVYQSFTNADFTSYDFETLRNSMINYLKTYYPETFNDFLESSEYLALIDMIAFLGQSLSFRTDLNARENFIDTAQRRDSILKLARMLSYNPTRTNSASGLLKFDSISTTETISDSNGNNLTNSTIHWNDLTNDNWLEQFTTVLNAAISVGQAIGKPGNSQSINGIQTDEYSVNLNPTTLPVAPFAVNIQSTPVNFEAVSATSLGQSYIYEADPTNQGKFNILYRNDNNGNGSNNTGFFLYFKQGSLQATNFTIQNAIPNNFVPVNTNNINNTDSWLYSLNVNNSTQTLWTQVPALPGINVVYNQLTNKNLYQITTRNNDQVNLVFGDGSFANIPQGAYRFYFRASNGLAYSITPDDLASVNIALSYISAKGSVETLTVTASLKYTVTNATASQSLQSIKTYAPQQYYTQNRMITGEDYNIFPLTNFTSIQKIKAVNRTSSGVSLYLDTLDPTGSFSSTNIFGSDGVISANTSVGSSTFSFLTTNDIYSAIYNDIIPVINSTEVVNYYYANYPRYNTIDSTSWTANTVFAANSFVSHNGVNYTVTGNVYAQNLAWTANTIFSTGANVYYSGNSYITTGNVYASYFANVVTAGNVAFLYPGQDSGFNTIIGNVSTATGLVFAQTGYTTMSSTGNITASGNSQIIGEYATGNLNYITPGSSLQFVSNGVVKYASVTKIDSNTAINIGTIIPDGSIVTSVIPAFKNDLSNELISTIAGQIASKVKFGLTFDQINQTWINIPPTVIDSIPSSGWLLKFTYNAGLYNIEYKNLKYQFASANETHFYFDPTVKVYDSVIGSTVTDTIKILKNINSLPNSMPLTNDLVWNIYDVIVEADGYVDSKQVLVKIPDSQMPGVPDNPDLYTTIANTDTLSNLYFQYKHNSPSRNRIDPTPVNLIDLYILTADYATSYTNWLRDLSGTVVEPVPPTSSSLEIAYGNLDNYKTVSDSLIYNPAQFKPLFGAKADVNLQARFQVVKNPAVSITDNEVKTQVIAAINAYFNVANWDFGETFYFSELAAYLHSTLAPNIASVLIVPANDTLVFGNYFQINAEPWEIITSAATVDTVDIISAVTAAQLNLGNNLIGTY